MNEGLQFLISTLFSLFAMALILRVWMQAVQANYFSPVASAIRTVTDPVVLPVRKILPSIGRFDLAAIFLALVFVWLRFFITSTMNGMSIHWVPLLVFSVQYLFLSVLRLLFWILIIRAILSWFSQGQNPIEHVLYELTEPMLSPIRRLLPPMGGLDLSVLVLIILVQFLMIVFAV